MFKYQMITSMYRNCYFKSYANKVGNLKTEQVCEAAS